jgi:hypothetical protein
MLDSVWIMKRTRISLFLCAFALIAACSEEPRPRTVTEFLDNPLVLEAAVVRCSVNREETRYDAECVNARQAITILEAKEERAKRDAFEAQSERKREALRRTQEAAAEARRRSAEQSRLRSEAEYLAQFGELPPSSEAETAGEASSANAPTAVIPKAAEIEQMKQNFSEVGDSPAATDGGNAPVIEAEPESDLEAIREELRKRNEESAN